MDKKDIENYFNKFKAQNDEHNYLIGESVEMEDKEKVLSKIVNSIELEIFVQKIFKNFHIYFLIQLLKV